MEVQTGIIAANIFRVSDKQLCKKYWGEHEMVLTITKYKYTQNVSYVVKLIKNTSK